MNKIHPPSGLTPLLYALAYKHKEIVRLLLDHNANANFPNEKLANSPFFYAIEVGDYETFQWILDAGADPLQFLLSNGFSFFVIFFQFLFLFFIIIYFLLYLL